MSDTLPPGAVPPVDPTAPPPATWSLRRIAELARRTLHGTAARKARLAVEQQREEARGTADLDALLQGIESAASDLQKGFAALALEIRRLETGQAALSARVGVLEAWRVQVDTLLQQILQRLGVARG